MHSKQIIKSHLQYIYLGCPAVCGESSISKVSTGSDWEVGDGHRYGSCRDKAVVARNSNSNSKGHSYHVASCHMLPHPRRHFF